MGKHSHGHGQKALGWSVELCGGTHVRRTGDIGLISVTGGGAVSSGVRRIEALTGRHARKHASDTMALARSAALELRTTIDDVPARIASLMEERKKGLSATCRRRARNSQWAVARASPDRLAPGTISAKSRASS